MQREISIPLGIIVSRTETRTAWRDEADTWRVAGIMLGASRMEPGSLMQRQGQADFYYAGSGSLELYAVEIDSYLVNLAQDVPQLYVVLKTQGKSLTPPLVHLVTVAPDEAESYLEGDEFLIDGTSMPQTILELVASFVDSHCGGVPQSGRKRAPISS